MFGDAWVPVSVLREARVPLGCILHLKSVYKHNVDNGITKDNKKIAVGCCSGGQLETTLVSTISDISIPHWSFPATYSLRRNN